MPPLTVISDKDMKRAEGYARLNCQDGTICGLMDWEPGWLQNRPDILKRLRKKRQQHKLDIRKGQAAVAKDTKNPKGRGTMLIWQGKNALGQTDKLKTEHDVSKELKSVLDTINGGTKGMLPDGDPKDSLRG